MENYDKRPDASCVALEGTRLDRYFGFTEVKPEYKKKDTVKTLAIMILLIATCQEIRRPCSSVATRAFTCHFNTIEQFWSVVNSMKREFYFKKILFFK